jgi:hypothetical protein
MDVAAFEALAFWSKIVVAVCGMLIAVAAAVALYASSAATALKTAELQRVQASTQAAVATAEAKAVEASERAAAAQAAAAAAEARAALAEVTQQLGATVAETPASVTPPKQDASGPRHLIAEQRDAMVAILKTARLPQQIDLSWIATAETYAFAKEVGDAFRAAGWTVNATGGELTRSPSIGVSLSTSRLSNETLIVRDAFDAIGIELRVAPQADAPNADLKLMIGLAAEARRVPRG